MRKEVLRHLYASTKTIYEQLPDPTGGADNLAQFVGDVALLLLRESLNGGAIPRGRTLNARLYSSF